MATVAFYFDFGSPNAYLAHKVIPGIEARTGATFAYLPILLGGVFKMTNNQSPMAAFAGVRNKLDYERREMMRFVQRHGVSSFRMNPNFPVNTLRIMRGAVAAKQIGVLAAYVDAMFADMWERGRKMDDPGVVSVALEEAGLPAAEIERLAATDEVKGELAAATTAAVERGVFGAPTVFVNDEMFFGKDRLRDVEEEILRITPKAGG